MQTSTIYKNYSYTTSVQVTSLSSINQINNEKIIWAWNWEAIDARNTQKSKLNTFKLIKFINLVTVVVTWFASLPHYLLLVLVLPLSHTCIISWKKYKLGYVNPWQKNYKHVQQHRSFHWLVYTGMSSTRASLCSAVWKTHYHLTIY